MIERQFKKHRERGAKDSLDLLPKSSREVLTRELTHYDFMQFVWITNPRELRLLEPPKITQFEV